MNELLVILQEECAEVSKIVSKIHRFGIESINPITRQSNKEVLHQEVGDLLCMIELCVERKMLDEEILAEYIQLKREKLKKWSNIHFIEPDQC